MRKGSLCSLGWPLILSVGGLIVVLAIALLRPSGISEQSGDGGDGDAHVSISEHTAGMSDAGADEIEDDTAKDAASKAADGTGNKAETSHSPVVFIGFGGLSWASISPSVTPHLYQFAQDSAVANLVVKTLGVTTCPNSAWLTLGTGQRTQESVSTQKLPCQTAPSLLLADTAYVHDWDRFITANTPDVNGYAPTFGSLATILNERNLSSSAIGSRAALALSDSNGNVTGEYIPLEYQHGIAVNAGEALNSRFASSHDAQGTSSSEYEKSSAADSAAADIAGTQHENGANAPSRKDIIPHSQIQLPDVTMIDLGSARAPGWEVGSQRGAAKSRITAAFGVPNLNVQHLEDQASTIDAQFGAVLAQLPENATVIAASLNESDSRTAQLQFFAMHPASHATNAHSTAAQTSTPAIQSSATQSHASAPALSNSTRHSALVQNTDIPVTILSALGIDLSNSAIRDSFVGSPIAAETITAGDAQADEAVPLYTSAHPIAFSSLTDLNQRAVLTRAAVGPFLIAFGVAALLYGIISGIIYGFIRHSLRQPRLLAWLGLTISAVPASALLTNLIPWWRTAWVSTEDSAVWNFFRLLALIAAVLAFICMKLGIAVTKRRTRRLNLPFSRHSSHETNAVEHTAKNFSEKHTQLISSTQPTPEHATYTFGFAAAVFLCIVTVIVFITDAATGSHLHFTSVLGAQQPQDGSRFYGFGNTAHVTVALAFLFLALAAARFYLASGMKYAHSYALAAIIGLGLTDLFANASSSIGADFGGTIGIVAGFGLLGLLILRTRVHAWQYGLVLAAGSIVAGGFAITDWLRPASKRTHVGTFVQSVLDGDLGQVLSRKLELFAAAGSPLVWFLTIFPIIGVMTCTWLAAKTFIPAQLARALHHGAIAAVALTIISLAINDSGPLLPFLAAAFAVPLWLAASVPLAISSKR